MLFRSKEQQHLVDGLWMQASKEVAADDLQADLSTLLPIFRQVDFPDSSLSKESKEAIAILVLHKQ